MTGVQTCALPISGTWPGITVHPYGKGRGICLAGHLGSFYHSEGHQNTLNLMQDVLFSLCGMESLALDLTPMVEVTLREKEGLKLFQLVNTTGCFANKFVDPVPIREIELVLPGVTAGRVGALNGGEPRWCNTEQGLSITLPELRDYEAITIE